MQHYSLFTHSYCMCTTQPYSLYGPQEDSVSYTFTSQSHHSALCHLGSSTRSLLCACACVQCVSVCIVCEYLGYNNTSNTKCPYCRLFSENSVSSVPRSHSYSTSLPPSFTRRQKLLAVRDLFQKAYRTAVPDLQASQGAMAFATGLLSRLPLFGSSSDTRV